MFKKIQLVIAPALLIVWLHATAGPYTNALKITNYCTSSGMEMGDIAYEYGEESWKTLAKDNFKISELEAKIKNAPKNRELLSQDERVELRVAEINLPTDRKINSTNKEYESKIKDLYLTRVVAQYGKNSQKIASRIWFEVSSADSVENARDLAYATCMDYFIEK